MGIFKPPCKECEIRVDCLILNAECIGGIITMWNAFKGLFHSNAGWIVILVGVFITYFSSVVFFLDYFVERRSVTLLCIGGATVILGVIIIALNEYGKDCYKEMVKKCKNG